MVTKHPRLIIKHHGTIKNYRYVGDISVVITVRPIKIFIEYVGANMSIQVPLLVIDQRGVSVMST